MRKWTERRPLPATKREGRKCGAKAAGFVDEMECLDLVWARAYRTIEGSLPKFYGVLMRLDSGAAERYAESVLVSILITS
jgi:hypothetical protein